MLADLGIEDRLVVEILQVFVCFLLTRLQGHISEVQSRKEKTDFEVFLLSLNKLDSSQLLASLLVETVNIFQRFLNWFFVLWTCLLNLSDLHINR